MAQNDELKIQCDQKDLIISKQESQIKADENLQQIIEDIRAQRDFQEEEV
jgi:hypothetical protein